MLRRRRQKCTRYAGSNHKAPLELLITYGNVRGMQVLLNAHPRFAKLCGSDHKSQNKCGSDHKNNTLQLIFALCWIGNHFNHDFRILKILMEYDANSVGCSLVRSWWDGTYGRTSGGWPSS